MALGGGLGLSPVFGGDAIAGPWGQGAGRTYAEIAVLRMTEEPPLVQILSFKKREGFTEWNVPFTDASVVD